MRHPRHLRGCGRSSARRRADSGPGGPGVPAAGDAAAGRPWFLRRGPVAQRRGHWGGPAVASPQRPRAAGGRAVAGRLLPHRDLRPRRHPPHPLSAYTRMHSARYADVYTGCVASPSVTEAVVVRRLGVADTHRRPGLPTDVAGVGVPLGEPAPHRSATSSPSPALAIAEALGHHAKAAARRVADSGET